MNNILSYATFAVSIALSTGCSTAPADTIAENVDEATLSLSLADGATAPEGAPASLVSHTVKGTRDDITDRVKLAADALRPFHRAGGGATIRIAHGSTTEVFTVTKDSATQVRSIVEAFQSAQSVALPVDTGVGPQMTAHPECLWGKTGCDRCGGTWSSGCSFGWTTECNAWCLDCWYRCDHAH